MAQSSAPRWWYSRGAFACALLPLSGLFFILAALRRRLFGLGLLRSEKLPVPVIVVGNLIAGGSGKTPATLCLVEGLRRHGWRPGILSRGYGGRVLGHAPVLPDSDPSVVGDEPLLMARRSGVPVFVGRDRAAAGRALLAAHPEINVLVTDDGLQHYRLRRDLEIVVLDEALLGNRWLMPAGPLREPLRRARETNLVLAHGAVSAPVAADFGVTPVLPMSLRAEHLYRLTDAAELRSPEDFRGLRVRAIAGIGRPQRFFDSLRALGIEPAQCVSFPDHHAYTAEELSLAGCDVLLMTEKDAIKCAAIAPAESWVLPVAAEIPEAAFTLILEHLHGSQTA